jgi:uncharacterized Ntn-hydrolase superfamily protein
MADGKSARETLDTLLANDPNEALRQVGLVDARGGAAAHTGKDCMNWAGHKTGEGFACQGNVLTGAETVEAMAATFASTAGDLVNRLLAALLAGDTVGGDRRGRQSAALLVAKANSSYGGDLDRYLDLRVDDDPQPVQRLQKLVEAHRIFFGKPRPEDRITITRDIAREIQSWLYKQGYLQRAPTGFWDTASQGAFSALIGNENLEERWSLEHAPDFIDQVALNYLRERFG